MAQRDRFQQHRGVGSEFASGDQDCPLVAIAMKAGYCQVIETINESEGSSFDKLQAANVKRDLGVDVDWAEGGQVLSGAKSSDGDR